MGPRAGLNATEKREVSIPARKQTLVLHSSSIQTSLCTISGINIQCLTFLK